MPIGPYLGALGSGIGPGYSSGYDDSLKQAGLLALGRALQGLGQQQQGPPPGMPPQGMPQQMGGGPQPMPQGGPPVGAPPQGGSGMAMGMPPPGGAPNAFANRFPATSPMGQPIGSDPDMQATDPSRAGGYAALYATMPQGQLPQQAQPAQYQPMGQQGPPQGQQQGPPQGAMPDINRIAQQIAAANPGAPPQVIAAAVEQYVKNIGPMLYRDAMLGYRGIGVDQRQQGLNQRQEVVDAIKQRTNALYGPGHEDYFAGRAGATATGRTDALTQPIEGGGGATRQSAMATERAFASSQEGRAVRSFNVVTQHLGVLEETAKALQNNQIPRANALWQTIAKEVGSPVPTNFDAVKTIVLNELNKAIIGGAGAVFDRAQIQDDLNKSQNEEQIFGVIQKYIKLAAGQLDGLQKQYEAGTGKKDFDQRFISSKTKELMRINVGTGEVSKGSSVAAQKIDRAAAKKAGYTDKEIDDFEAGK